MAKLSQAVINERNANRRKFLFNRIHKDLAELRELGEHYELEEEKKWGFD